MARILTVTSGKGGVGKTNVSVNLAIFLSQKGYRTCLFDADLGLANINILLGIYPEYNLKDVIDGTKSLSDIIIHDKSGIDIIPGSSGVAEMESLSSVQLSRLSGAFSELKEYDYFIFDTSAGVSKSVVAFCMSASEVILVITPEPTSLTDAYALIKVLSLNGFKKTPKVVVNQSKNSKLAQIAYKKLKDTTRKFLGIELSPLGTIASDPNVIEAVSAQRPFITLFPKTQASRCITAIGNFIVEKSAGMNNVFSLDTFWQRCIDLFSVSLKMPARKSELSPKETAAPVEETPPTRVNPPRAQPESEVVKAAPADTSQSVKKVASEEQPPRSEDQNRQFMEQLIEKISSVSEELSGIRKILETGTLKASRFTSETPVTDINPLVTLDFEAFLAEQKAKNKKRSV